ncbi:MAG: hypothetical protein ACRDBO_18195 [Lachnospiraceae bacterium]
MISVLALIKSNLIKQLRCKQFFIVMACGIAIAYFCVPDSSAGYEIFFLGGVHAAYNSFYLGAMAAVTSMVVLWFPGFYLLRSQVTDDRRLKLGQIIASRPVTKLRYIAGKAVSNLGVLIAMELIFIVALAVMQFIRGEADVFNLWGYLNPFLQVTLPYMIFLAALTVLFDVVPFLQGLLGNILYFVFWLTILPISLEIPQSNLLDLFGLNRIMGSIMNTAAQQYPSIDVSTCSMGYSTFSTPRPMFTWSGLTFDGEFLLSRLFWIAISVVIIVLSSVVFDRFREAARSEKKRTRQQRTPAQAMQARYIQTLFEFSPVIKSTSSNILRLLSGEIRNMITGYPIWWYLTLAAGIGLSAFMPINRYYYCYTLALLALIPVWSKMGNQDRYFGTIELVSYRCSAKLRWLTSLLAGLIISTAGSAGFIIHLIAVGDIEHLVAFLIGILFINGFALTIGTLSQSRVPFEAIFIIWYYLGPIQNIPWLDFFGLQSITTVFYGLMALTLIATGYLFTVLKDNHILKYI